MTTAIDTNVLLDVQRRDPAHFEHSAQALDRFLTPDRGIYGRFFPGLAP